MGYFEVSGSSRDLDLRLHFPDQTPDDEARDVAARAEELRRRRGHLEAAQAEEDSRRAAAASGRVATGAMVRPPQRVA